MRDFLLIHPLTYHRSPLVNLPGTFPQSLSSIDAVQIYPLHPCVEVKLCSRQQQWAQLIVHYKSFRYHSDSTFQLNLRRFTLLQFSFTFFPSLCPEHSGPVSLSLHVSMSVFINSISVFMPSLCPFHSFFICLSLKHDMSFRLSASLIPSVSCMSVLHVVYQSCLVASSSTVLECRLSFPLCDSKTDRRRELSDTIFCDLQPLCRDVTQLEDHTFQEFSWRPYLGCDI